MTVDGFTWAEAGWPAGTEPRAARVIATSSRLADAQAVRARVLGLLDSGWDGWAATTGHVGRTSEAATADAVRTEVISSAELVRGDESVRILQDGDDWLEVIVQETSEGGVVAAACPYEWNSNARGSATTRMRYVAYWVAEPSENLAPRVDVYRPWVARFAGFTATGSSQ